MCSELRETVHYIWAQAFIRRSASPRVRAPRATAPAGGRALVTTRLSWVAACVLGTSLVREEAVESWVDWGAHEFEAYYWDEPPPVGAEEADCDEFEQDGAVPEPTHMPPQRWSRVYYRPRADDKKGLIMLLVTRFTTTAGEKRWVAIDPTGRLQVIDLSVAQKVRSTKFAGVDHGAFPGMSAREKAMAIEAVDRVISQEVRRRRPPSLATTT